jgi:hypothetical protein
MNRMEWMINEKRRESKCMRLRMVIQMYNWYIHSQIRYYHSLTVAEQ